MLVKFDLNHECVSPIWPFICAGCCTFACHDATMLVTNITGADLILRGWRAVNTILSGARQIPTETEVRRFMKPGSYQQALHDFESVSPIQVHSFTTSGGVSVLTKQIKTVSPYTFR